LPDLAHLAAVIRDAPGLRAKRELTLVAAALPGIDGDDAAVVPHGAEQVVLAGEAIAPAFAASDPYSAGAAAVVTNISDVRAMGGRPVALVDTVVSPDREHARQVLEGLAWAANLFGVPVAGGHLTLGGPPAVSAVCTGLVQTPMRASAARPGDPLIVAFCLDGEYRGEAPFFSSLRVRSAKQLRVEGDALVEVAEDGLCRAARDISMPGVGGSLLQLLELSRCGATLHLDRLPRPSGTPLERWLVTFPSFGFVLAAVPGREAEACAVFRARGLAAEVCGVLDSTHVLRVVHGDDALDVWDLSREPLTALRD
jgi:selenophosphate synthetase-related protein